MTAKEPKGAGIEKYAESLHQEIASAKQQALFEAAIEAGYLTALADSKESPEERASLVRSIQAISAGAVIEWEVDTLLDDVAARVKKEGANERAGAVGAALKEVGHAEAGLVVAALVALANKGVDKREAAMLERIGAGAGLSKSDVGAIVKKARGL